MENSECAICGNTELLNRLCNDEYLCDDHYIVEHHGGRCPCHLLPSPPTVCGGTPVVDLDEVLDELKKIQYLCLDDASDVTPILTEIRKHVENVKNLINDYETC